MNQFAIRLAATSAAVVAGAGMIAACGSSGSSSPAASQPAASQPATPSTSMDMSMGSMPASEMPAATSGSTVNATETEFHIMLSSSTLKAGTYTFAVKNAGSVTHALTINGPGVSNKASGDIDGGQSTKLTVTLKAGKYDVYCPVGNHKMLGMDTSITVS